MERALAELSRQLAKEISSGRLKDKNSLNRRKNRLCKALGLKKIPTNADILKQLDRKEKKLLSLLLKKPVRSLSGIAVVAVMSKPHQCPGECLYCPNSLVDVEIPKSYTGKEPATRRAINSNFNPFVQADNRVRQLEEVGHLTDKIDLIVMGGTFPSTPFTYQKSFVKGCLDECNICEPEMRRRMRLELEHMDLQNKLLARQIALLEKSQEYRCCPTEVIEVND